MLIPNKTQEKTVGKTPHARDLGESNAWVWNPNPSHGTSPGVVDSPIQRLVIRPISFLIHFSYTENEKKENAMNTIALALILLVRVIVPFSILIAIGEWVRRREINYWFRM